MNSTHDAGPPAVVVGACAHGLAVIRSLARAGVEVHIVDSDPTLPGLRTRHGKVHLVEDINGPALVPALLALARALASPRRPILFLTNDRMVKVAAGAVQALSEVFSLSFSASAQRTAALGDKVNIEQRCREAGLNYPATTIVDTLADLSRLPQDLTWPRIIKPSRPLAGFKVKYAASAADAVATMAPYAADFPVLLQEWIEGDDTVIRFTAFYLENGTPLARFDGRKLRSFPMGHTTVAEPSSSALVHECARTFFAGTGITGPASLEVKMDAAGVPWIIEPTVGRTDFWLDLCIANGVDLPVIEYRHQAGLPLPECKQVDDVVWLNPDRDRGCLLWYLRHIGKASRIGRRLRFTYLDRLDPGPFFHALKLHVAELRQSVAARLRRLRPSVSEAAASSGGDST